MPSAADPVFTGFHPDAIDFLAELAANNERGWFQPRKGEFERLLKRPMQAFVAALAVELATRDLPLRADPERSIFRIHRDTRFAKDKSPYKTHVAASFPWIDDRHPDLPRIVADGYQRARPVLRFLASLRDDAAGT